MSSFIDLSRLLVDRLPVYPGDEPFRLQQIKTLDADAFTDYRLSTGMHAGTHIDGPMHLTPSAAFIGDIAPDYCIGNGCILNARGQRTITAREEYRERIRRRDIVLVYTGWSEKFGDDEYYRNFPVIDEEFADLLIERDVKMLALDTPSPDRHPFFVHTLLLKNNILIAENLVHLETLAAANRFEVIALPLRIAADSAPARVVAKILE